jgi:hypothetical protein
VQHAVLHAPSQYRKAIPVREKPARVKYKKKPELFQLVEKKGKCFRSNPSDHLSALNKGGWVLT